MSKIANFPYPTPIPAKIWGVSFGVDPSSVMLGSAGIEKVRLINCEIIFQDDHDASSSQSPRVQMTDPENEAGERGEEVCSNDMMKLEMGIESNSNQTRTGQLATDVELEPNRTRSHEEPEPNKNLLYGFLKVL